LTEEDLDMKEKIERNIERTYGLIRKSIPHGVQIDSLEVVKEVEEYRQFWKPDEINVILLAESHVYTDEQDYKIKCRRTFINKIIPNYPLHFVRFVYCLGYGENGLLERKVKDNIMGTWQFWKIFSSCVAENEHNLGFEKVLKTKTPLLLRRLSNKVNILKKMKEKGIWLLDASIVGLYRSGIKNYKKIVKRIIEICWKNHLLNIINESQPKHIIVIGKEVENILGSELRKTKIPFTTVLQPQARGNSQEQLERYKKYQRICTRYAQ